MNGKCDNDGGGKNQREAVSPTTQFPFCKSDIMERVFLFLIFFTVVAAVVVWSSCYIWLVDFMLIFFLLLFDYYLAWACHQSSPLQKKIPSSSYDGFMHIIFVSLFGSVSCYYCFILFHFLLR